MLSPWGWVNLSSRTKSFVSIGVARRLARASVVRVNNSSIQVNTWARAGRCDANRMFSHVAEWPERNIEDAASHCPDRNSALREPCCGSGFRNIAATHQQVGVRIRSRSLLARFGYVARNLHGLRVGEHRVVVAARLAMSRPVARYRRAFRPAAGYMFSSAAMICLLFSVAVVRPADSGVVAEAGTDGARLGVSAIVMRVLGVGVEKAPGEHSTASLSRRRRRRPHELGHGLSAAAVRGRWARFAPSRHPCSIGWPSRGFCSD
jgi:hypothetical protein